MVGQEHITKILKNQIKNGKVGHAYLFSGGRGSGKTSTAKILARAVNCLNPIDGEPCNECQICLDAINGNLVDVVEMDAASNNGVDNIRDIREEVEFIPTSGKFRVYIIDEVHMLSTGAFNALLKTLEEPPAHVIFILATTEPQKLPETILSRCLRFDFGRISVDNIIKRLNFICDDAGIKAEDGALRVIARLSDGAMRDAISILDRCSQEGNDIITENSVRELSGVPKFEALYETAKLLLEKDEKGVLNNCNNLISEGKNIKVYLSELIKFLRDVALFSINEDMISYGDEEKESIRNLLKTTNKQEVLQLITRLSDVENSMRWAGDPSIMFETGLIKICFEGSTQQPNHAELITSNAKEINSNLTSKVLTILKENGKIRLHADLLSAKFELQEDGIVHIIFSNTVQAVSKENFQRDESKIAIKSAVKQALGKEVSVKYDNLK